MEPITLTAGAFAVGKLIAAGLGATHLSTTALTALGAVAVASSVFFTVLTIDIIAKWFQQHQYLAEKKSNIAITIKIKLERKEHAVVQGIFNKNAGKLEAGRTIGYKNLDSKMQQAHRENDLVVYPV